MDSSSSTNTCIRGCCFSDTIPLSIPKSSLTLTAEIAQGSESVVYEAKLNGITVAAKKPRLSTSDDLDRYHKELQLLIKLDHPHIVKLVTAHAQPPDYTLVFKHYENGNLAHALHVADWRPSLQHVLQISWQLASALQHLHHLGILHRDVKPANVLLDSNWEAHLGDFGLAVAGSDLENPAPGSWKHFGRPTGGFHKKNMVGTLLYMAPEILKKEIQTEKSDVYGYGVMINELLTGVVPYTDLRTEAQAHTVLEMTYTEQQLAAAITSGLRPVLCSSENGFPLALLSLVDSCWHNNPLQRPSFNQIKEMLEKILSSLPLETGHDVQSEISLDSMTGDMPSSLTCNKKMVDVDWSLLGEQSGENLNSIVKLEGPEWLSLGSILPSYCPILSWGSYATRGGRETMEDTSFVLPLFGGAKHAYLFGIFDGHRGSEAAEFAAQAIPHFLLAKASLCSPSEALVAAFLETDVTFRKELDAQRQLRKGRGRDWHPGCTAITVLFLSDMLFVANAGDCRAVLCRDGQPVALSKDHTSSCIVERERVVESGGEVKWQVDSWRVGNAALQVTRSIGDDDLKPAVTAEPEVTEVKLTANDEFLVIASDGLWDEVTNEDVISLIKDTVKEPNMSSKRLVTVAVERGGRDNISVTIIFLQPISTIERVF